MLQEPIYVAMHTHPYHYFLHLKPGPRVQQGLWRVD